MGDSIEQASRFCALCGKEFIMRCDDWAYKTGKGNNTTLYCSWKCLREHEKKKAPTKIERRERVIKAIMDYPDKDYNEIAKMTNAEPKTVWYWIKKLRGNKSA